MLINSENLRTLGTAFNASYQGGLEQAPTDHLRVASEVPSSTGQNEYGWLGQIPNVREWLGDRVVQNLQAHSYTIKNKDYELTIGVRRNDIEDDNVGIYGPMFSEMGRSTGAHPCELVYKLLKAGFATTCYDGQYFFDTDHPVLDATGTPQSVVNTDGGGGEPWFLIDDSRALKPLLLQWRKKFEFIAKDRPTDENVFQKKEFQYGADARMNVGFGFWQFAWGSKQTLDDAHYKTARAALANMTGDYGRPLGLQGKLLVVGPNNEEAARTLLRAERNAAGATNVWMGSAEMLVSPWLAAA